MENKEQKHLRIIRLESENIKRLRAVVITPKGDVVQITGANDNGKTSVLDSIFLALKQTFVDAPKPIKEGEQKARIRLDLGGADGTVELVVERVFGKGAGLKVETADGGKMPAPQRLLDGLIGALSFDPLAFTRMKPREQYDELRRSINLAVDLDRMELLNRGDFDRRAEINRHAKERRAEAELINPQGAEGARVDESALLDQIQSAGEHNARIERIRLGRVQVKQKAASFLAHSKSCAEQAAAARAQAEALDKAAAAAKQSAEQLERELAESAALPEPTDIASVRAELEKAQATNATLAAREAALARRQEAITAAERFEAQALEISERMAAREAEKAKAIEGAQMPVEGLGFGEGLVTYKGVPFQQASSAVQLRVSLGIAMAANPRLRVIRIQDGSLLDENSMAAIAELAKDRDFQIWIERVDTSGKVGIFIEDGSVKAIDGQPAKAKA